jgi:2-C-methyl-D-erythritol 4-phosphate cytidylyltransferase
MSADVANYTCGAVVVAAGLSRQVRKPYLEIQGEPVLAWTARALCAIPSLRQLVTVTRPEDRPLARTILEQAGLPARVELHYADGGTRRQDSVRHGLEALDPSLELALIHDAARPFPPLDAMLAALDAARKVGGAILALPARDTIKREGAADATDQPLIQETVSREGLWLAHTPQVFQRENMLRRARQLFQERPELEVTDDAAVFEHFGDPVVLIPSSASNLKITRPEDVPIASALLQSLQAASEAAPRA